MKTWVLLLISLTATFLHPSKEKVIRVENMEELINALGSNTTILLASDGNFQLSDLDSEDFDDKKQNPLNDLSKYYQDNYIQDLKNLSIIGQGKEPPTIFQADVYDHVLKFRRVENVYLKNIRLGHAPELGWCQGGVLLVQEGKKISLEKLELFGSGTEGLSMISVEQLRVRGCLITKCTEQLSSFSHVRDALIIGSDFTENAASLRGFGIYNSELRFEKCFIQQDYPFSMQVATGDSGNCYEQLFCVDGFDYGKWYAGYEEEDIQQLNPPINKSQILFKDCWINDEQVEGSIKLKP